VIALATVTRVDAYHQFAHERSGYGPSLATKGRITRSTAATGG